MLRASLVLPAFLLIASLSDSYSQACDKGFSYSPRCLISGPCQDGEREAAVMDYAGAVYEKNSNQRFDGRLTETECASVKKEFGILPPGAPPEPYLSAARKAFFRKQAQAEHCREGAAFETKKFSNPKWGEGIFLGTFHLCGARIGEMFAPHEMEILSRPQEWLLFLENSSDPLVKNANGGEAALLKKVSSALNIPLEDPMIPEPELGKKIATKYAVSREEFTALFFLAAMSGDKEVARNPQTAVKLFATQWGVDPEALARQILALAELPRKEIERKVKEAVKRYDTVIAETSPSHIREALKRHGKAKALFIVGNSHLDLGPLVYEKP